MAEVFDLDTVEDFPPRYNIAPTQPVLIVAASPGDGVRPGRRAMLVRWGLLPGWVKDARGFPLLFNARSETAAEKAAFRAAMRHRRILVPASGFYEWRKVPGAGERGRARSQPFWVRPRDGGVVAFAGLAETHAGPDGAEIDTGAILTTRANAALCGIHERMPVVVRPESFARWLDCQRQEPRDVADLMVPVEDDFLEAIPIGDAVNAVANDDAVVQEPADHADAAASAGRHADEEAVERDKNGDQLTLF